MFSSQKCCTRALVLFGHNHKTFSTYNILQRQRIIDFTRINRKSQHFMNKSAGESKRKKKAVFSPDMLDEQMSQIKKQQISAGTQRRAQHLSAVFHENISFLINSQQVCPQLIELGLEIVQVKMAPDLCALNVYWLGTGGDKDEMIEKHLDTTAFDLRDALSKLRLMGRVPPIHFIKDTSQSRLQEVERLLSVADMGEDFVPTDLGRDLKSEPTIINPQLKQTLQEKLKMAADRFTETDIHVDSKTGPGGSVEIMNSARSNMSHTPTDVNDEQMALGPLANEFQDDPNNNDLEDSLRDLNLRSDIYELDQASLMDQVITTKRKMVDRSYGRRVQEVTDTSRTSELNWQNVQKDVTEILSKRQTKINKPVKKGRKMSVNVFDVNREDRMHSADDANVDVHEEEDFYDYDQYDKDSKY